MQPAPNLDSDPNQHALSLLPPAPVLHESREALKQNFLDSLANIKSKAETLRQSVVALLDLGVPWQHLIAWAKAAGRNDRYSQKLLSAILLDLGIRRREAGAGPKLPREAYLVEAYVHELYGGNTAKFLRAACNVAKDREKGELDSAERLALSLPRPTESV